MRSSCLLLAAAAGAAVASVIPLDLEAEVFPRSLDNLAPSLPLNAFPTMQHVPFDDAKAKHDSWELNHTHTVTRRQSSPTSAEEAACSANPNVRFEWNDFSDSDRLAFMQAIQCLQSKPPTGEFPGATSGYEDLVALHQQYTPYIHNNAKFTIWHRYFLWTFEQVLRAECGFDRAFPWWDETLVAGNFHNQDLFTSPDYFGELPAAVNGNGVCVTTGAFAGLTCHIGPGSGDTPHCLSRAVDESLTAQCSASYVSLCQSYSDYAQYEQCIEDGPHGYGHDGIGAVMSDVAASPSDPIFWMHHSFIDHTYRIWQNADVSVRTTTVDGVDAEGDELTLDTLVYMGNIMPAVPISMLLNTEGGVNINGFTYCYRYNY